MGKVPVFEKFTGKISLYINSTPIEDILSEMTESTCRGRALKT